MTGTTLLSQAFSLIDGILLLLAKICTPWFGALKAYISVVSMLYGIKSKFVLSAVLA